MLSCVCANRVASLRKRSEEVEGWFAWTRCSLSGHKMRSLATSPAGRITPVLVGLLLCFIHPPPPTPRPPILSASQCLYVEVLRFAIETESVEGRGGGFCRPTSVSKMLIAPCAPLSSNTHFQCPFTSSSVCPCFFPPSARASCMQWRLFTDLCTLSRQSLRTFSVSLPLSWIGCPSPNAVMDHPC